MNIDELRGNESEVDIQTQKKESCQVSAIEGGCKSVFAREVDRGT